MVGKGEDSSGYKIAFFPPSTLEGAEGFLVGYSVCGFDEVWDALSALSRDEILALDKPANRAYVMTDLSYCDGVGNTLNTAQKDLVTGDDVYRSPARTISTRACSAPTACSSLEKAGADRLHRAERRQADASRARAASLSGSFASDTRRRDSKRTMCFLSANGFAAVKGAAAPAADPAPHWMR